MRFKYAKRIHDEYRDEIKNKKLTLIGKIELSDTKWVAVDDVKKMIIQAISIYGDDTLENDVKLLDFFDKKLKELKVSDDE